MKAKVLKYVFAKGKNKRINILLYESQDGDKFFTVETTRLQDFKTRNILNTHTVYSVETFFVLSELMEMFISEPEIKNKIINRELSKITPFQAHSNIKSKP